MGYTTRFEGQFTLDRPLTPQHKRYLDSFAATRRMKRDAAKTAERRDPVRTAVGLPVGIDGGYFVNEGGFKGQGNPDMLGIDDILDRSGPPSDQPGLWCQWVPSDDGTAIVWDGKEKFYNYREWLDYLIEHFLTPWGYTLSGSVRYQGESVGDVGAIIVEDNERRSL